MNIEQQLVETKHWEDRYRLIIQAGKNLPEPSEEEFATMHSIPGCEVQVWFKFTEKTDRTFMENSRRVGITTECSNSGC